MFSLCPGFRRRRRLEACRYYLIPTIFGYGGTEVLTAALEETSRLVNAYSAAILICDFLPSHLFSISALCPKALR